MTLHQLLLAGEAPDDGNSISVAKLVHDTTFDAVDVTPEDLDGRGFTVSDRDI